MSTWNCVLVCVPTPSDPPEGRWPFSLSPGQVSYWSYWLNRSQFNYLVYKEEKNPSQFQTVPKIVYILYVYEYYISSKSRCHREKSASYLNTVVLLSVLSMKTIKTHFDDEVKQCGIMGVVVFNNREQPILMNVMKYYIWFVFTLCLVTFIYVLTC